jgi:hypothetical protein
LAALREASAAEESASAELSAHGVGADVDVVLGFDLARSGHLAGEIAAHDPSGLYRDNTPLTVSGAGGHSDDEDQ